MQVWSCVVKFRTENLGSSHELSTKMTMQLHAEKTSQQAARARHFSCVAGILTQPSTSSRLQLSAMIAPTPVPPPSPATTTSQQNTATMVPSTSCSPFLTSNLLFPITYFLRQDSYTASWPNNILSPRMSHSMILLINRVVHIGQDKSIN